MRIARAAAFLPAVVILTVGACSKPADEAAPEAHGAEASGDDHGKAATEEVVTMEQAVEEARAAAEAPAVATPPPAAAPTSDAAMTEGHDAAPADLGVSTKAAPAPAAEHASGH